MLAPSANAEIADSFLSKGKMFAIGDDEMIFWEKWKPKMKLSQAKLGHYPVVSQLEKCYKLFISYLQFIIAQAIVLQWITLLIGGKWLKRPFFVGVFVRAVKAEFRLAL